MSPLSLLTKGRTIRGLKERPGAYKLSDKSALPNFSGSKPAPAAPGQSALFEQAQPQAETPPPAPAAAVEPKVQSQPAKPGLFKRLATWAGRWKSWRKERPFQRPAVQTELALDKVKVIRNDLNEGDVELVARQAGQPAQCEEVGKTTAKP